MADHDDIAAALDRELLYAETNGKDTAAIKAAIKAHGKPSVEKPEVEAAVETPEVETATPRKARGR